MAFLGIVVSFAFFSSHDPERIANARRFFDPRDSRGYARTEYFHGAVEGREGSEKKRGSWLDLPRLPFDSGLKRSRGMECRRMFANAVHANSSRDIFAAELLRKASRRRKPCRHRRNRVFGHRGAQINDFMSLRGIPPRCDTGSRPLRYFAGCGSCLDRFWDFFLRSLGFEGL